MKTLLEEARPVAGDRSQWGEGRVISEILRRFEMPVGTCVEFGAGDGLHLSNTAHLWYDDAWTAVLVESEPELMDEGNVLGTGASYFCALVTANNVNAFVPLDADVVSIDVDGKDIDILEAMYAQPSVLCVEHHPMIPAHISWRGGAEIGCSALALREWGDENEYVIVAMTHCNTILVPADTAAAFGDVDTDFLHMFDPSAVTYVLSNVNTGDYTIYGPWGFGRGVEL